MEKTLSDRVLRFGRLHGVVTSDLRLKQPNFGGY